MGLHAKAGRLLVAGDGAGFVVVDETVAARVAPGTSAVGRTIRIRRAAAARETDGERVQIVGVVSSLPADPGRTRRAGSILRLLDPGGHRFVALYIRTRQPESAVRLVRDLIASQDSRGPWTTIETAESKLQQTTNPIRSLAFSAGALAVVALLLSAIGLGGVTAYVVSLRRREIGVRLALGGRIADVVFMIVRQSLRLVSVGVVVGLALAVPATLQSERSLLRFWFWPVSHWSPRACPRLRPRASIPSTSCAMSDRGSRIRPGASHEQRRIGRTSRHRSVLDPDVHEVQKEVQEAVRSFRINACANFALSHWPWWGRFSGSTPQRRTTGSPPSIAPW
jgi:hypothetical protein